MKPAEEEQAFLEEVYRKARLLEFDKREAEKVQRNSFYSSTDKEILSWRVLCLLRLLFL